MKNQFHTPTARNPKYQPRYIKCLVFALTVTHNRNYEKNTIIFVGDTKIQFLLYAN